MTDGRSEDDLHTTECETGSLPNVDDVEKSSAETSIDDSEETIEVVVERPTSSVTTTSMLPSAAVRQRSVHGVAAYQIGSKTVTSTQAVVNNSPHGACDVTTANITCGHPCVWQPTTTSADEFRKFMTYTLGGLYTLLLIVVGSVLSLATALTHRHDEGSYYMEAFDIYLYVTSLLFLAYVHVLMSLSNKLGCGQKTKKRNNDVRDSGESNSAADCSDVTQQSAMTSSTAALTTVSTTVCCDQTSQCFSQTTTMKSARLRTPSPSVTLNAPGVNFYLRLGAIGFGTGCMIHDLFRLAEFIEDGETSLKCHGPLHIVVVLLHVVFTVLQTFFLFKSHKIAVRRHQAVVRLGLMHLIATNVCVWFATTVKETHQDFLAVFGSAATGDTFLWPTYNADVNSTASDWTDIRVANHSGIELRTDVSNVKCGLPKLSELSRKSAPYLFPCTIEYSLIAAAILYKMYRHVGVGTSAWRSSCRVVLHHSSDEDQHMTFTRIECHKANRGLFLGLFVVVLTLVAVSYYFIVDNGELSNLTFFGTEIVLLFLLCVTIVLASFEFQKLRFSASMVTGSSRLDQSLLIIATFGVFMLECFHLVSAVGNNNRAMINVLAGGTSVLAFAQAAAQTIFILDALQRSANNQQQTKLKPGRALVTFLILCNLSLWVVGIFEVKKVENLPIHATFYGYLPWSIISHLCIPLIIFYRFHSTVCLSEIWVNAYHEHHQEQHYHLQQQNHHHHHHYQQQQQQQVVVQQQQLQSSKMQSDL